jgi:hypothetical protein
MSMNIVYKTIPKHTSEDVKLDQVIELYFMLDMNKNTILQDKVILFNVTEQKTEAIKIEYQRRVLKVTPLSPLKPLNHYQLQLVGGEKGVKDITGRTMAETYELEFHTLDVKSIKPPLVVKPTDVSVVKEQAEFVFTSIENASFYEVEVSKSNTFHTLVWPLNDEKVYLSEEVRLIPDIPYETGLYYMRVRSVDKDGNQSSWSPSIRYFYDGAPIIHEQEEESLPEPVQEEPVAPQSSRVVLQAISQVKDTAPSQLDQLQNVFSSKVESTLTGLYVKSTTPKDKSVNNKLPNLKKIVIQFTDDIDPSTVDETTCYLLTERN